jgi:hypothetical protein
MLGTVFVLLVVFEFKHFIADFLLQVPSKYMLGKFKPDWNFVLPLAAHCGVHALFTLVICLYYGPNYWWLAIVDFVIHFLVDRLKAGPKYFGRFKNMSANEMIPLLKKHQAGLLDDNDKKMIRGNAIYYITLGLDQALHNLTHYGIIYMLVKDLNDAVLLTNLIIGFAFAPLLILIQVFWLALLAFAIYRFVKARLA